MKKTWLLLCAGMMLAQMQGVAQNKRKCGTAEAYQKYVTAHPEMQPSLENNRANMLQVARAAHSAQMKTTAQVTVPIVFHIVLTQSQLNLIGGANGVKQRVDSQVAVINRDFNMVNSPSATIPAVFQPLQGNPQIRYVLATKTPSGAPSPGYEIIVTSKNSFGAQSGDSGSGNFCSDAKYGEVIGTTSTGGAPGWYLTPHEISYLNVWIINFTENNILGIACPPSIANDLFVPKRESGVCINYRAFGKTTTTSGFISGAAGGRTLSHELGHYFNLRHIWADEDACAADDDIGDTPKQDEANFGCPTFPQANCDNTNGGEMFMNFMDYVDDNCYRLFTKQQCDLMTATANSSPANELLNHPEFTWPTDVATIEKATFSILPNPATSNIYISTSSGQPISSILLTDMTGRNVRSIVPGNGGITDYNLDVSSLPRGIYTLQCTFASGTAMKKIVLQ